MQMRIVNRLTPLFHLGEDLDRIFGGLCGETRLLQPSASKPACNWMPSIELSENEKRIVIRAEIPGVNPDDIDVTISGRVLTISGEKQELSEKDATSIYHSERRFGSFRRVIQLPTSVNTESVTATHRNGVVEIGLDKKQEVVPKRIPVEIARN